MSSITSTTIDNVAYHAEYVYDESTGGDYTEEVRLIIDPETGQPIPKTICLCAARSSSECCCGAWDDVPDSDWDIDLDWD